MKWFSVLAIAAAALLSPACEKHPASELVDEHGSGAAVHTEAKHEAAAPGEKHEEAGAKPGEAPKFFPETK